MTPEEWEMRSAEHAARRARYGADYEGGQVIQPMVMLKDNDTSDDHMTHCGWCQFYTRELIIVGGVNDGVWERVDGKWRRVE